MYQNIVLGIGVTLALSLSIGISYWIMNRVRIKQFASDNLLTWQIKDIRNKLEKSFESTTEWVEKHGRFERIKQEKIKKFLNIPNISFHFADKDRIRNFYNDYFSEPTFESLVSEIISEASGEVKGSIPQIIESKIGNKDLSKWISTIKLPDITLNGMFKRYQRETIRNNEVALGIEEVEIELSEVQTFNDSIAELKSRFGFNISESVLDPHRSQLREKAANETLLKLEQATGSVLIEGRFKLEEEDENFYRCTYNHPVNHYLSENKGPVVIVVLIPKNSLETSIAGNYTRSIGSLVPLRVYGDVWKPIDTVGGSWELQITPLAVY